MNKVFVCSPLRGDVAKNIENAKRYARFASSMGNAVFVPHLLYPQFLDDDLEFERNIGIRSGIEFLKSCNEIWVFAKDYDFCTEGMRKEIDCAKGNPSLKLKYIDPSSIS